MQCNRHGTTNCEAWTQSYLSVYSVSFWCFWFLILL